MGDGPADIDSETITRVASRILQRTVGDVTWEIVPLRYAAVTRMSEGLYRVSGTAHADARSLPWSCILKVSRAHTEEELARMPADDRARVLDVLRWDREGLAYESGLLDDLPEGVAAPRCYGVDHLGSRDRLWLEHVVEHVPAWDVRRYGLAARHLGRLNGTYLAGKPLPSREWLSRDWIRKWTVYFVRSATTILEDDRVWSLPVVASAFDPTARDELRTLLGRHPRVLDSLDALPQTLGHLDAYRANMLGRQNGGVPETVLIDWSCIGYAPLGADLAHLVVASLYYHGDRLDLHEVEDATLAGYEAGLRDAGYAASVGEVRRAYVRNAVARMTLVLGPLGAAGDPTREERLASIVGRPYPEIVQLLADRTRYLTSLARELD